MSVIKTLSVRVATDNNPLDDGFAAAIASSEEFARRVNSITVAPRVDAPAAGAAAGGDDLRASVLAGLAPLQDFGRTLQAEIDRMGGAFITLARRIDLSMKEASGFTARQLDRMALGFKAVGIVAGVSAGAIATAFGVSLTGPAALGIAALAVGIPRLADVTNRTISTVSGYFTRLGNVAKKTMTMLGFGPVIRGLASIVSPAKAATQSVRALRFELGSALGIATGFGAAGGLVTFLSRGIRGAAGLGESLNKVDVAFGAASGDIKGLATGLADAFGAPKGQILDAATGIGLLGRASGLAEKQAAGFAGNLTRLAVDAKSFHHVGLDVALDKIRSGLAGQAEPLREWGVMLTEAAVASEAVRMGLATSTKEVGESAKVQARASLITKGLSYVTGDMAATAGSTANMFDALRGRAGELATSLGQYLLPAADVVLRGFNGAVKSVMGWVEANKATLASFGTALADVAANVGAGFANLAGGLATIAGDIAGIFGYTAASGDGFAKAIGEAFAFVGFAWRHMGDIATIVWIGLKQGFINAGEWAGAFGANLGIVATYIGTNWRTLIVDAVASVSTVFLNLGKNIYELGKAVVKFLADPTQGFQFNWTPLLDGFKATSAELPALIRPQLTSLQDEMDASLKKIGADELAWTKRTTATAAAVARKPFAPMAENAADAGKGAKGKKPHEFAGAFDFGSKEAYSAVVKAGGFGGGDAMAGLVEVNKKQLSGQAEANKLLGGIAGGIAALAGKKAQEVKL